MSLFRDCGIDSWNDYSKYVLNLNLFPLPICMMNHWSVPTYCCVTHCFMISKKNRPEIKFEIYFIFYWVIISGCSFYGASLQLLATIGGCFFKSIYLQIAFIIWWQLVEWDKLESLCAEYKVAFNSLIVIKW